MKGLSFAVFVITIMMLVKIGADYSECDGEFVRGLFWFKCIGGE